MNPFKSAIANGLFLAAVNSLALLMAATSAMAAIVVIPMTRVSRPGMTGATSLVVVATGTLPMRAAPPSTRVGAVP